MSENATTSSNAAHPSPHRDRVGLTALWFGIAAAPLAWDLQLLFGVSLAGRVCFPHADPLNQLLWNGVPSLLIAINIAAFLMAGWGGMVSWRSWQRTREERPGSAHDLMDLGDGRSRFMAMCGVIISGLFLAALTFGMVAFAVVPLCGR